MNKTIKQLVLFLCGICIITVTLCAMCYAIDRLSGVSKEQKEARLKAEAVRQAERQERQKLYEQLKTESGLRQYLTGKTYVYADDPKIHWLKISFVDENHAIVHLAKASERSWGECIRESLWSENTRLLYKWNVKEFFDDYGRKNGEEIHLNVWGDLDASWWGDIECVYSDSDYFVSLNTRLKYHDNRLFSPYQLKTVTLQEVDANYFPPEWKD